MQVHFNGFAPGRDALNGTTSLRQVAPLDVARATALTCGPAPGLEPLRRLMRLGSFVLETLAHLDVNPTGGLRVVGLDGLDPTARSELSQRLGVGCARVIAESPPIGLIDLYALDALSRSDAAPTVIRRGPSGKRPDFVGADVTGRWSVLEAKARSARGTLLGTRARAHAQAQAVNFEDLLGRIIPIDMRIGSVARLGDEVVDVWFEDPPSSPDRRVYAADPDELLHAYYQPVRDLIEVYGSRLRGVSGITGFGSAPLPGTNISLAVHHRIQELLDEPSELRAARAALQDDFLADRQDAIDIDDRQLSVGRDGIALEADSEPIEMVTWFRELRDMP